MAEKLLLLRAGRIGLAPWPILIAVLAILVLPMNLAMVITCGLLGFVAGKTWRRAQEVKPTIDALLENFSESEVSQIVAECRSDRSGSDPSIVISEKVCIKLQLAQLSNCANGHQPGCKHRKVEPKDHWPGALIECVRKGQDPIR